MRGSVKLKLLLIGLVFFLFALVAYRNSEGAAYAYEVCILKIYTIECSDGTNNFSTTQYYWDCITYFGYLYEGGGDGGSSGGGNSNGGGDLDDPGSGGGGGIIINNKDANNDGIIDCFNGNLMSRLDLLVSSCYGMRYIDGEWKMHNGIDIAVPVSAPSIRGEVIYSLADGEVMEIGYSSSYGYFIKIKDRNGYIWLYAHLLNDPQEDPDINIKVGDKVNMGLTTIGKCDSTGNSTGDHIHIELMINNNTVKLYWN
ncbi:MAG: M23 family metallopeptidase [Candidatus Saccharicenans sp.]